MGYIMQIELQQLQEVFNRVFADNQVVISIATLKQDVEQWDSLGHLNLVLELEETFEISLGTDDIINIKSIQDIITVFVKY